jgi:hypothetical protein
MPMDAMTLMSRVVDRAGEKFTTVHGMPGVDGAALLNEEALVELLATRLLQFLGFGPPGEEPAPAAAPAGPGPEEMHALFDELAAWNHRVAGAVGACDCWGELPGCRICGGRGAPGWMIPDREAFDVVVRPALHKLATYRTAGVRNGRAA